MKKYTTSTDIYKEEIAKNTLKVSLKEEKRILMEVQAGNLDSKEHLFNKYLGFIVAIAEGLVGKESDILSDLIQEGNIILLKCINNYSLTLNTRFHGYVYINVLRGMQDYLLINKNYFNFSTKKLYLKDKIDKFINAYITKYGINPSEARVNYIIKTKLQQYYKLLSTKDDVKSLIK